MRALRRLAGKLLPRSPREVASPEQELRFTRSRQALTFLTAGITALCLAGVIFFTASPAAGNAGDQPIAVHSPWWFLFALAPAGLCLWVVVHCMRHAFIILTPLGIELFPFWLPARNMQVIYWAEIKEAGVSGNLKTFTIMCRGRQIMAALAPIPVSGRILLKQAIEGRMKRQPNDPALNN